MHLCTGRTVLLISHRYSAVRDADRIYVLDCGRIIEHGGRDQLIAQAGIFGELFGLQVAAHTGQPSPNGHRNDKPDIAVVPRPPWPRAVNEARST